MVESNKESDLLQNYFVTRGHSTGNPYNAVTRLPFDEALKICEATYPWRGTGEANADGHRDQKDYLRLRIAADDWLRVQAIAAGVRIDDKYPVAFTFVREPEKLPKAKLAPVGDREITQLAIKDLDLSNWSFTLDDSVTNYTFVHEGRTAFEEAAHPAHGKVMNAQQLAAAIEKYGDTNPDGSPRVIEAQMWAQEPSFISTIPNASPQLVRPQNRDVYRKRVTEVRTEYAAMAPDYDEGSKKGGWNGPTQVATALQDYIKPGMHVLDGGTGTGEAIQRLREIPVEQPLHIIGLDLSEDMLKVARDKQVADELHAQDLAKRWPVTRASQDAVISSGVFEYLDDKQAQAFVGEAARALKAGGRIALTFRPIKEGEPPTVQKLHSVERIEQLFRQNRIEPQIAQEFDAYQGSNGTMRHVLITDIRQGDASLDPTPTRRAVRRNARSTRPQPR